jgi:methylenetetrahydrofolate dehydrogenase (NADP+)/methenyltetrahydrofolate cyclohydrolase
MMATLLKGAEVASALCAKLEKQAADLAASGVTPTLAIIRMGERPDDVFYENAAIKRCEKVGIITVSHSLPADLPQEDLLKVIDDVNSDDNIHGVLIFRPLPGHIDDAAVRNALCPHKDVDGITNRSLAGIFVGEGVGFAPCTAQACIEILDHFSYDLTGKRIVIVGRSLVVGKPLSMMLLGRNATVTICHTRTADLPAACRDAEILIVAAGKAGVIDSRHVSPGQVVVDVGINAGDGGKMVGDVLFDDVQPIVGAITAVPGGVGSVTASILAKHVIMAASRK